MVKNFPNTNAKEKTSLKSNLPLYKPYAVGESKLLIADLYKSEQIMDCMKVNLCARGLFRMPPQSTMQQVLLHQHSVAIRRMPGQLKDRKNIKRAAYLDS
jgi:hypothetical protein